MICLVYRGNFYSQARITIKQLQDEKELAQLVETARINAEKVRAMSEVATAPKNIKKRC